VEIANDRMFELWGRLGEDLIGKPLFERLPEVKDQGYEEILTTVFTTGERFTAKGIPVNLPRKGGMETVFIDLLYEAFRETNGTITGVMAVATDVTDQVLDRMKVEESVKEFKSVTDFMPQMIWVTRPDGYHYYYNKQWYDYTGLSAEETEGEGWNNVFHPEDQGRAWEAWRQSLKTGEPYEIEYRCKRVDGVYRWFLGRALPLRDNAGKIAKWFGTCTDIDDQKKSTELLEENVIERTKALETQKNELQRSNSKLEEFTYAASHDLKEPMRKISIFTHQLKDQLGDRLKENENRLFSRILKSTERMANLVDDLLLYSHVSQRPHETESIDLNQKAQRVLEDLELDIEEKNAVIEVAHLPVVEGYRRQIQQVFQNLITNALKYSRPGFPPHIIISAKSITEHEKPYHVIVFKDNGIGFEQQYADKIFHMFTRLHGKNEYGGTGVGLTIVRKVIENHQGFIRVKSVVGEGSVFEIYLPA
jgi:two-component system CheB/CheR fusion protein